MRFLPAALLLFLSTGLDAAVVKEYPLPSGTLPNFITVGPDGNMWFTEYGKDSIGIVTVAGTITHHPTSSGCGPIGITAFGDGNVWYTCAKKRYIGYQLRTPDGAVREVAVPRDPVGPITTQNGSLWYTTIGGDIEGVDSTGAEVAFVVVGNVFGLASGRDRLLWHADSDGKVGTVNGTTATAADGAPYLIADCSGGLGVWFTELGAPNVGFLGIASFDSTGKVEIGEFPLQAGEGTYAEGITCAGDGSIWYTLPGVNRIGHRRALSNAYVDESFTIPTAGATPYGIAQGPDGSIWFTENSGNRIGRVVVRQQGDVNGDGQIDVADVFWLINFTFAGGPPPAP